MQKFQEHLALTCLAIFLWQNFRIDISFSNIKDKNSYITCIRHLFLFPHLHLVELSFQHSELSNITQGIRQIHWVMFTKPIWQRDLEHVF